MARLLVNRFIWGCFLATLSILAMGASLPGWVGRDFPNPEPPLPAYFDAFQPPFGAQAASGSPVFAEWMRQAGPGDTLLVTGHGLGGFTAFGQSKGDGVISQPATVYQGSEQSQLTLGTDLPEGGMILLWSSNASGPGRPVALNRTESWWLQDSAIPGETAAVFGRNFFYGNVTPAVYVKQGAVGGYAELKAWNNYRIDYVVPPSLALGASAEVWVHNGHGGAYGWSGPLTLDVKLTVNNAAFWSGSTFNIKDYGAKGDGATDDGPAIRATLNAAAAGAASAPATVYLPAGTYMTTLGFNNLTRVRWMGAGKDATIIKLASGFTDQALFYESTGIKGHGDHVEIRDMTLDINNNLRSANAYANGYHLILETGVNYFKLANLRILSGQYVTGASQGHSDTIIFKGVPPGNHAWMENCDIYGGQAGFHAQGQVFVKDCNFYGQYDAGTFASVIGGIGFSMTGCRAQDFDASADPNPSPNPNFADGRLFVAGGGEGSRNTYIAGNTTVNFAPRDSTGHSSNAGEQVLWESAKGYFYGNPSSATGNTISVPQSPTDYGPDPGSGRSYHYAVVISGKGMGQRRLVTGDNGGGRLTISPDWNVIPDGASIIQIQTLNEHAVVYQNRLEGKSNYATFSSASAGIQPYGNSFDFVAEGNVISRFPHGIFVWSLQDNDMTLSPTQFCLFQDNTIFDSLLAGRAFHEDFGSSELEGTALLGTVFRRNRLTNTGPGLMLDAFKANVNESTIHPDRVTSTLIDHNSGGYLGSSVGGFVPPDQRVTHTFISGNEFLDGPAPTPTPSPVDQPVIKPTASATASSVQTHSPVATVTPSASATRTATRTAMPSSTRTASPTPSSSATPSPTPLPAGVTLTSSPTPQGRPAHPAPLGIPEGQQVLAAPNPNPDTLHVKLRGTAGEITIRLYSRSLSMAGETRIPGSFVPGWNRLTMPASFGQGLANGLYYLQIVPSRAGLFEDKPKPVMVYLLR